MIRQLAKYFIGSLGAALVSLAVAIVVLAMFNNSRFDGATFSQRSEELLKRTRDLANEAPAFDAVSAERSLGKSAVNGFCYRFDDHLDDCQAFVQTQSNSAPKEPQYGTAYRTLGHEMRKVLFAQTSSTLRFRLMLPEEPVKLHFGYSFIGRSGRVEFSVVIRGISRGERVFSSTVSRPGVWRDAPAVDLSGWANRMVEIALSAQSSGDQVAYWSSPVLLETGKRNLNLILAVEDGLRADRMATYGHDQITTSVKDEWINDGVLFEDAIAQASATRPSMASIMTSLYPEANGVLSNADVLDDAYLTLAEVMRQQGFLTAAFVQNTNAGVEAGLYQGFDYFVDQSDSSDSAVSPCTNSVFGDELQDWLRTHRRRNVFIYLHSTIPQPPQGPSAEGTYDLAIQHSDTCFKQLLIKLDDLELSRNTLLTLISDHGRDLGEHGEMSPYFPAFSPSIKVPLMMAFPNSFPQGVRIRETVQLLDVMPTFLDVANVYAKNVLMQGDPLKPLIWGEDRDHWDARLGNSYQPTNNPDRSGPWGSVSFGSWYAMNSALWSSPDSRLSGFQTTGVFNREADPINTTQDRGFALDYLFKKNFGEFLTQFQLENLRIRMAFSEAPHTGTDHTATVEQHLRELNSQQR
ncbi:MAG: sulfatase [bacterium]|nr:sulfatase [bacterium]